MSKKGGLGKGLGAIFGENPSPMDIAPAAKNENDQPTETEISVQKIKANPFQPRRTFDTEKLEELAASIKEYGIVQPLVVRKQGHGYEVVAGERRLRAAKLAGLTTVPVIIREYSEAEMMEIALIENIQRHDLNPMEEAQGIQRLMSEFKLTQEQVAAKVGRSRAAVANILRLLNLAPQVQEYIRQGILTMGQAKQLVSLPQVEQLEVAQAIIDNGWSSRITEEVVRQLKAGKQVKVVREIVEALDDAHKKEEKKKKVKPEPDMYCQDFQNRLVQLLGTKVKVVPKAMDKEGHQGGTIEIEYYSAEDLERIYEVLHREEAGGSITPVQPRKLNV